jgi:hypothetical protein
MAIPVFGYFTTRVVLETQHVDMNVVCKEWDFFPLDFMSVRRYFSFRCFLIIVPDDGRC